MRALIVAPISVSSHVVSADGDLVNGSDCSPGVPTICASLAVSSAGGAVPARWFVFVLDRAVLLPTDQEPA